ncbi:hypothetical protein [Cellulophaga sp. Hel_I_12]|uniref:hypothetical protein n=1 Tax=Cellulophaga sp. Hel_I_12 TaxID=1249972 RepID=UPI0006456019|nr:hypothetical protein [Cellulophaga sp. Hel_I_12]
MKVLKKILWLFLSLMILFLIFLFWYQNKYSMDVVEPYQVNSPQLKKTLLIASQGSHFKNKVTSGIVDNYKTDSLFIHVIDVSSLDTIKVKDYNALLILHTWETWNPPVSVEKFIKRTKKDASKIVVFTTSGDGNYKMDGVDAITGESKLADVPLYIDKVTAKLNPILKLEK